MFKKKFQNQEKENPQRTSEQSHTGICKQGFRLVDPRHTQADVFFDRLFAFQSKPEDMKVVKDCINITRSYCDLTHVWANTTDVYVSRVVGFREKAELVSCMGSFFLESNSEFVSFIIFIITAQFIITCFPRNQEVL